MSTAVNTMKIKVE